MLQHDNKFHTVNISQTNKKINLDQSTPWLGLKRKFSLCDLHASKHEAELVRLVMRGNIVQVQYSDLEYAVVRTEAEVGYSQNGGQLKANTLQPVIKQEKQYKD